MSGANGTIDHVANYLRRRDALCVFETWSTIGPMLTGVVTIDGGIARPIAKLRQFDTPHGWLLIGYEQGSTTVRDGRPIPTNSKNVTETAEPYGKVPPESSRELNGPLLSCASTRSAGIAGPKAGLPQTTGFLSFAVAQTTSPTSSQPADPVTRGRDTSPNRSFGPACNSNS